MIINKYNYEEFFIDYFDGNLSAEQVAELFLFLETEPALKMEFENFSNVGIEPDSVVFPSPEALKRGEINRENYNWYLVASVEGDLTDDDKLNLEKFIAANPDLNRDIKLYSVARLEADTSIVYEDKKQLKQPVPFVFFNSQKINFAIAAILLLSLIAGSYFIFTKNENTNERRYSEMPKPSEEKNNENDPEEKSIYQQEKILKKENTGNMQKVQTALVEESILKKNNIKKSIINTLDSSDAVKQPQTEFQPEIVPLANAVPTEPVEVKPQDAQLAALPLVAGTDQKSTGKEEKYMTVWEAIRKASDTKINKAVEGENELLAFADESSSSESKLIDLVGKGINKLTNDKVKLDKQYNAEEKKSSFRFSAGAFKIEKN